MITDPQTYQEWLDAAEARHDDAKLLLARADISIGSVYMAGYALECAFLFYGV
jgi:hypothetical protein